MTQLVMSHQSRRVLGIIIAALVAVTAVPCCTAQAMHRGVNVELAQSRNAVPVPDADNQNALIVSVTGNGSTYFGIDAVSPGELTERIRGRLLSRAQVLYVKVDARAPYANVVRVLDAARSAGVEAITLLTAQPESPKPGIVVAPKGIELQIR
jgi:biopolymer transport protein ExbD